MRKPLLIKAINPNLSPNNNKLLKRKGLPNLTAKTREMKEPIIIIRNTKNPPTNLNMTKAKSHPTEMTETKNPHRHMNEPRDRNTRLSNGKIGQHNNPPSNNKKENPYRDRPLALSKDSTIKSPVSNKSTAATFRSNIVSFALNI